MLELFSTIISFTKKHIIIYQTIYNKNQQMGLSHKTWALLRGKRWRINQQSEYRRNSQKKLLSYDFFKHTTAILTSKMNEYLTEGAISMTEEIKKETVSDEQLEAVSGGVNIDQLRRENLDKDAADFDQLRRENLDKDAVSDADLEGVAGGVSIDQLRGENLEKDASGLDEVRRENLDKD